MKTEKNETMYDAVAVVSELNRVPGFDPIRFLRQTPDGKRLDLKYKKLWFRLKYPTGRIKLAALKITDQLAIIEARVYFDKNDTQPKSSFIAQRDITNSPGGLYIESAQHAAIDRALSDAGFGIQFIPYQTDEPIKRPKNTVEPEQKAVENTLTKNEPAPCEAAAVTVNAEETEPSTAAVHDESTENAQPDAAKPAEKIVYTMDMSVDEICSLMSLDEAMNYIVTTGTCKGLSLSQVAQRRPASLKFYLSGYTGDDNILRAAARLVSAAVEVKAAS